MTPAPTPAPPAAFGPASTASDAPGVPIALRGLGKRFGTTAAAAVDDVSLEVPAGAFLVLLGPSGCGKSTTLRMLAGLEEPTSGTIALGDRIVADGDAGTHLAPGRRGVGMVFQGYALWPHMTVRQNIEWPLRVARWSASDRRARVADTLRLVELDGLADRLPAQLSGGQQQRVAIARTIAPRPSVLLFDEPLSNLDARLRVDMRAELVRVHRESGATSVYVTHDQSEALAMATHVAVMRGGRLEQIGTPDELVRAPATAFVAEFLGTPAAVLVPGEGEGAAFMPWNEGTRLAMYRPEEVRLAAADGGQLDVDVLEAAPLAGRTVVTVRHGSRRLAIVSDAEGGGAATATRARLVLPSAPVRTFAREEAAR
ncbi:ABC transporter ATP-binding protein [Agrococcus sp. ARC_14]|uniref:ABC transporter ATP-binding protein n=1 Tax=Agrococcus sp. ARC_14 TaxID=2919927 RepID=UPI001F0621AB|nr:ABC transporter ATP-binding protein [Agrococcus sp. ARC_14]MCH1882039.1 ABC transporter ATP-binding protein [Agrococcus sp. ARC_14]